MKKIIVITTGGTIGSILQSDSISVDTTEIRISQEIERAKMRLGYTIKVMSPINKNSESFSPTDWKKILNCLDEANQSDADGVVVTHGTDTMAYSVAAAICYSNIWSKKICFTGAYYPPDDPSSDTSLILLSALEFAASHHPANGIYVSFRSNQFNSEARIIHGEDLKPMNYDDQYIESAYGEIVSTFSPNKGISKNISHNTSSSPNLGSSKIPSELAISEAIEKIACISIYPGINKKVLEDICSNRKVLIVHMYHSGTAPADPSYMELVNFIKQKNEKTIILMGTFPRKHIKLPYNSTKEIRKAGAHIYADLQPYFLYVFSLLSLSVGLPNKEIIKKLSYWEI